MPRPSGLALAALAGGAAIVAATFVDAGFRVARTMPALSERAALAERLELTDLALFTEARYTRHPSQADRHAAFQDHPLALEHFPSGSLVTPRRADWRRP